MSDKSKHKVINLAPAQSQTGDQPFASPQQAAEWVAHYLWQCPDFFEGREPLVESLQLKHPETGQAVSLIQRQLSVLREKKQLFENQMSQYVDHAHLNTQIFSKIQKFTTELIKAKTEQAAVDVIYREMQLLFAVDETSIHSFYLPEQSLDGIYQLGMSQRWAQALVHSLKPNRPLCGHVEAEWRKGLFHQNDQIASVCIVPLGREKIWGILALGSLDLKYNDDDTLFLEFIGDVVAAKFDHLFTAIK